MFSLIRRFHRFSSLLRFPVRSHHIYIDHYDFSSTGIPLDEFRERRKKLIEAIRKYLRDERDLKSNPFTVCLPSAIRQQMGPDVLYFPFKQQSDFYYFTGCLQPDAIALLDVDENGESMMDLYLSPCTFDNLESYQRWFGPIITDRDEICQMFAIDHVYSIDHLLTKKLSSSLLFYSSLTRNENSTMKKNLKEFINRYPSSAQNDQLHFILHHLRSVKSAGELEILRQACRWTSNAFVETMKTPMSLIKNEAFVKARFQFECEKDGRMSMAFYPVVAARGRSNILHYQQNNQSIENDDLIMLDAGGLVKQYASDLTRLWPLNGRFSSIHRQLYEILLTIQKKLIEELKENYRRSSRHSLNRLADQLMIKYLREESILSRTIDDFTAQSIVSTLCPTSVGHHLGLDVHDCDSISFYKNFSSGNVITIEPGLYIPWDCPDVPVEYRGFATRIEDDVLFTDDSCEVLTAMCPKEVKDLYSILDQRKINDCS